MKTIEEKARAYDEVREKIAIRFSSNVADEIFSEYEESKDERIKKYIIKYFEASKDELSEGFKWNGITVEECIAWLEKQGEKETKGNDREISNSAWSEEDRIRITNCIQLIGKTGDGEVKWLKSLESRILPQPKQDWSEEVEDAISLLKHIAEEQEKDYCPYNANNLRKVAQYLETCRPKTTWKPSDEQIDALVSAIDVMIDNRGAGDKKTILLSGLYHELKAL